MPHKSDEARKEYNRKYYEQKKSKQKNAVHFCDGVDEQPTIKVVELATIPEEPLLEVSVEELLNSIRDDDNYFYLKAKYKITRDYENWSYYNARVNAELLRKKAMWGKLFWFDIIKNNL